MAVNYVKFFRGTPLAFQNLADKNSDTLYFISDVSSKEGSLYLGDKLIVGNISDMADLKDVLLSDLENGDLLVYDQDQEKWINKSVLSAIGLMGRAYSDEQGSAGLVPAPGEGQEGMFLRGDGTWATPEDTGSIIEADHKSIELLEDGITLSLKNFGKKYYRHGEAEGEYILQEVNAENPWIEGLEPRVVEEDGELVLGWFQPSSTTIEGVSSQLSTLSNRVDAVADAVATKADASSVYSKEETEEKIAEAIVNSDHLTRKTFDTLAAAEAFAAEAGDNAENYVYMVLNTEEGEDGNKYLEYLFVNGALELVGTWKVNLSDYATLEVLEQNFVKKVDGYGLISNTDVAKLATIEEGAQKNLFKSVDGSQFFIDENSKLTVKEISISTVTGLSSLIEGINTQISEKASKTELQAINGEISAVKESISTINNNISGISTTVENLSTTVSNLNNLVNSFGDNYVTKTAYDADMTVVNDSITWHELT